MKSFIFIALALMLSSCKDRIADVNIEKTNTLLDKYSENQNFSGVVLIAKNDSILFKKAYGYSDWQNKTLNHCETSFGIASTGKMFTSLLVYQLIEKGKLDLEKSINNYIPEYKLPNDREIKIKNLLSHTSGFEDFMSHPDFSDDNKRSTLKTTADYLRLVREMKPAFKPGEKFRYSNSGYLVLQAIIEKLYNKSYKEILDENLFTTMKMDKSGYKAVMLAKPYKVVNNDIFMETNDIDNESYGGAGGLFSNVDDLFKFSSHLHHNTIPAINDWKKALTPAHEMTGLERGLKEEYSQGFIITKVAGQTLVGHDGGDLGFSSSFQVNLKDGLTIIILSNNANVPSIYVMDNLIKLIYGEDYDTPEKSFASFLSDQVNSNGLDYLKLHFKENAQKSGFNLEGPIQLIRVAEQITSSGFTELAYKIHQLNIILYPETSMPINATAEYFYWGLKDVAMAKKYFKESIKKFPGDDYATNRLKEIK